VITALGLATLLISATLDPGGVTIDPIQSLTQYGPLGLIVLGFITGWIVPGPAVKAKDAEIKRLQALFEDQVVPMTQTYATTMAQTTEVLKEITPILHRASEAAERQHEG
jgi:hypothetical protein